MSGLCAWWWEHATSSRSLRTGRFYLTKSCTLSKAEILGNPGLTHLLMHQSVILIRTWLTIKVSVFDQCCVSRVLPASSTHRLFEGDRPQYTTIHCWILFYRVTSGTFCSGWCTLQIRLLHLQVGPSTHYFMERKSTQNICACVALDLCVCVLSDLCVLLISEFTIRFKFRGN